MALAIGIGIGVSFAQAVGGAVTPVPYTPALKFNDKRNSQYVTLVLARR